MPRERRRLGGIRTHLTVPLLRDDLVIGVMTLWWQQERPFCREGFRLVESGQTRRRSRSLTSGCSRRCDSSERNSRATSPVAALISNESEGRAQLAGHRGEVTVVFCDLRGFTSFAETAEPEEVLDVLRAYQATLGGLVEKHYATLEHLRRRWGHAVLELS